MAMNRRIVLASRPSGWVTPENFRLETVPLPRWPTGNCSCAIAGYRWTRTCARG